MESYITMWHYNPEDMNWPNLRCLTEGTAESWTTTKLNGYTMLTHKEQQIWLMLQATTVWSN